MPLAESQRKALRALARETAGIDVELYERFGKDPLEPIIGLGERDARLGFFGRDPGRAEVEHGEPLIGSGGQILRKLLYQHLYGQPLPDFQATRELGRHFFWLNTVPYKPQRNRAWSLAVKRRFQPQISRLLLESWRGRDLITLGREAFFWFGIDQPGEVRRRLEEFWKRADRFHAHLEVELQTDAGAQRTFRLYPLPHPSPLNRQWVERFPGLLKGRLEELEVRPDRLHLRG